MKIFSFRRRNWFSIYRAILYVAVNQINADFPLLMEFTKFAKKTFESGYAVPDSPVSNPIYGFATDVSKKYFSGGA